jgi:inosine-uridine nucleoside N-ribohydrolase
MLRFVIDTDIGADDAVAIMMALRHPGVQVEAITTVAGNVGVEQAMRNALYVAELCGADVPVYQGMGGLCCASQGMPRVSMGRMVWATWAWLRRKESLIPNT